MPDHFVPGRFSGHVAIVTGSSADPSIGRACAMRLGREGAAVVINGRDAERLGATAAALADLEISVAAVGGSMEDDTTAHALVEAARERFGGVDLVVNTIGGTRAPGSVESLDKSAWLDTIALNTWPTIALVKAALSDGLAARHGAVVNISSGSPKKTTPTMIAYAAAKAALNALTRTMAADLGSLGVRVNAVSPGLTKTTATGPMWRDDDGRSAGANLLLGSLTEAEDIAAAVAFLLSSDARQITGVVLDVDGGNHLGGGGWTPITAPPPPTP